jgi:hypothetical protein
MLLFLLIPVAWLTIAAIVVAICRMAARGDEMPVRAASSSAPAYPPAYPSTAPAYPSARLFYSPRRPTTCGTVRSKILTSVHNDQLAT